MMCHPQGQEDAAKKLQGGSRPSSGARPGGGTGVPYEAIRAEDLVLLSRRPVGTGEQLVSRPPSVRCLALVTEVERSGAGGINTRMQVSMSMVCDAGWEGEGLVGKWADSICRGMPCAGHEYLHAGEHKRKLVIASQGGRERSGTTDEGHWLWGGCLALVTDVGRSSVAGNARHRHLSSHAVCHSPQSLLLYQFRSFSFP